MPGPHRTRQRCSGPAPSKPPPAPLETVLTERVGTRSDRRKQGQNRADGCGEDRANACDVNRFRRCPTPMQSERPTSHQRRAAFPLRREIWPEMKRPVRTLNVTDIDAVFYLTDL